MVGDLAYCGSILKRNIKFWLHQKVEKIRIKLEKSNIWDRMVRFEIENFGHLHSNTRAN